MKIEKDKFAIIVSDCTYTSAEANKIRNLLADSPTIIIKSSRPLPPTLLEPFYSSIGAVVKQNNKVKGILGEGGLVKVRQNGLFAGKEDGELDWHSAGMNRKGHDDIVAMYMHQIAETGGDTYFTDHRTAFDDLDDDTKDLCRNVKSKLVTYNAKMKLEKMYYKNIFSDEQTMMEFRDIDGNTSFEKQTPRKDLVVKHPLSKKEGLYFPWTVIRGFTGLDHDAQHKLYYDLKNHTQSEKYVYRHKWDPYDIVLSDQHHSLHKRDHYTGDRELWRAGIWIREVDKSIDPNNNWEYEDYVTHR